MYPFHPRWPLPVHRGQQCNLWRHGACPELWVLPHGSSMSAVLVSHVWLSRYHGPQCVPAPGQTARRACTRYATTIAKSKSSPGPCVQTQHPPIHPRLKDFTILLQYRREDIRPFHRIIIIIIIIIIIYYSKYCGIRLALHKCSLEMKIIFGQIFVFGKCRTKTRAPDYKIIFSLKLCLILLNEWLRDVVMVFAWSLHVLPHAGIGFPSCWRQGRSLHLLLPSGGKRRGGRISPATPSPVYCKRLREICIGVAALTPAI